MSIGCMARLMEVSIGRTEEYCHAMIQYGITDVADGMIVL